MAKKKRKTQNVITSRPQNGAQMKLKTPGPSTSSSGLLQSSATVKQTERITAASSELDLMNSEHGVPNVPDVVVRPQPSLEASLKELERLLLEAAAHYQAAQNLSIDAQNKLEMITDREKEIELKYEAIEVRETELLKLENDWLTKQADLDDQRADLVIREQNAEKGFLKQKHDILGTIEDDVKALREEQDRLEAQIRDRTRKAEEKTRKQDEARALSISEFEAARTKAEADRRVQLDREIAEEREKRLAELREELHCQRSEAEAAWQERLSQLESVLHRKEKALFEQEETLSEKRKILHADELELKTDREIFEEDREAHAEKLKRLVAMETENLQHAHDVLLKQLEDARTTRDRYFEQLDARRELDKQYGNRTPEDILEDLKQLRIERDNLVLQLRERPDASAAERIIKLEQERNDWQEQRAVLIADLAQAKGELSSRRLAAIEVESLIKQKETYQSENQLLSSEIDRLRSEIDELTAKDNQKNPMQSLTELDENPTLQTPGRTTSPIANSTPTLLEFAEDLRHRIAKGVDDRTLFYRQRDIRSFLGGLSMSKLMLLQGISGTGKTSLPLAFASAVGGKHEVIGVQASWRDKQDLIGYYNAFHKQYYAEDFLQALYKAGTPAYRDRLFMLVLDEINLARPEQFFADFIVALEQPMHERRITLVNNPIKSAPKHLAEGRHLPIPPNVWFIGTANHDESTVEFADKTYDRAHVMEMPRVTPDVRFEVESKGVRNAISYEKLEEVFEQARNKQNASVKKATQWLQTTPIARPLEQQFRIGWGNRLENQLALYLPVVVEAGGSIGEAMDHLLVTKILRKLKDRHDVRPEALEKLNEQLQTAWEGLDPKNPPERCDEFFRNEIATKGQEAL